MRVETFFFSIALFCDCLERQLCCRSAPHTRQVLIRVIEGVELAQLGPALMGSPCVLLNSLAPFFVPGQEGVATNEVGECKLSQQKEGKCEPPRGGGMQRKAVTYGRDIHTCSHTLIFVSSFFSKLCLEGSCGHQICIIGNITRTQKGAYPTPN